MANRELPQGRHVTYQLRMKYCYRATCTMCRSGTPSHGPYWYASWREEGHVRSCYLGKEPPPNYPLSTKVSTPPQRPSRWQQPLQVQTLGRLAVWRGGELIPERRWNRKKACALLGILLSQPGHKLHREQLLDLLWPDVELDVATRRLWSTLRQLREILDVPDRQGSHLNWRGEHVLLVAREEAGPDGAWLDAAAFEEAADIALGNRDIQACQAAIECYGEDGDYLPLFVYEDWAVRRREQLHGRLVAVLLHAATLVQEEGVPGEAEPYLQRILTVDSTHEAAICTLMRLLQGQGRGAEGIHLYQKLEAGLANLGLQPNPETRYIRDQLKGSPQVQAAADILSPRVECSCPTNLPSPISSFIGRTHEQVAVRELLQTNRLVTLTGWGGVGKTRLALAVATGQVSAFQDGVWLVELANLPLAVATREMLLGQSLARALGVDETGDEPLQALRSFLQHRKLLIVLDNCEHLVHECAALIQVLLTSCPDLKVLATSREPLNIAGEYTWTVPPLSVPNTNCTNTDELMYSEAAQLFVTRAQAKQPAFALSRSNAEAVAQICRRLDGIPLSLELAAARLLMFSVHQIVARLDDSLRLLTGGSRLALPRQQSLRATLQWSYSLLNEPERILMRRLSIFAGGCDLEAVEAVCTGKDLESESILDIVSSLVSKSLVTCGVAGHQARYWLLESVRQYGHEQLAACGEEEVLRERHCGWYVVLAEQAKSQLRGPEQQCWLDRLESEHDNVRTALEWSIGHPDRRDYGLRLVTAIWQFWYMRNYHTEGRRWLERVLMSSDRGGLALRAEALCGAGGLAFIQSDYESATALLEESWSCASTAGERGTEARALLYLANVAGQVGNYAEALSKNMASLSIFRERQDTSNTATALYNAGVTLIALERYEDAQVVIGESLQLWRSLEYQTGMSRALKNLARINRRRGNLGQAKIEIEQSMDHLQQSGAQEFKGEVLLEMGVVEQALGNYREALGHFQAALQHAVEIQDEPARREAVEGVAYVSTVASTEVPQPNRHNLTSSAQLLERAVRLLASVDERRTPPRDPWQQTQHDVILTSLRTALGEDRFTRCWMMGRHLTQDAACRLALDNRQLGWSP